MKTLLLVRGLYSNNHLQCSQKYHFYNIYTINKSFIYKFVTNNLKYKNIYYWFCNITSFYRSSLIIYFADVEK